MNKINIEGLGKIDDPFYRYKMARINIIRQKNKTIIDNIDKVCKDLERNPDLFVNYLKKKLSIALVYKNGILSMTKDIGEDDMNKLLKEFIELYVICEKCKLPETDIMIYNDKVLLDCKCCSFQSSKRKLF